MPPSRAARATLAAEIPSGAPARRGAAAAATRAGAGARARRRPWRASPREARNPVRRPPLLDTRLIQQDGALFARLGQLGLSLLGRQRPRAGARCATTATRAATPRATRSVYRRCNALRQGQGPGGRRRGSWRSVCPRQSITFGRRDSHGCGNQHCRGRRSATRLRDKIPRIRRRPGCPNRQLNVLSRHGPQRRRRSPVSW